MVAGKTLASLALVLVLLAVPVNASSTSTHTQSQLHFLFVITYNGQPVDGAKIVLSSQGHKLATDYTDSTGRVDQPYYLLGYTYYEYNVSLPQQYGTPGQDYRPAFNYSAFLLYPNETVGHFYSINFRGQAVGTGAGNGILIIGAAGSVVMLGAVIMVVMRRSWAGMHASKKPGSRKN